MLIRKPKRLLAKSFFFSPGNDSELLPDSVIIVSQGDLKSLYMHEHNYLQRTTDYAHRYDIQKSTDYTARKLC